MCTSIDELNRLLAIGEPVEAQDFKKVIDHLKSVEESIE